MKFSCVSLCGRQLSQPMRFLILPIEMLDKDTSKNDFISANTKAILDYHYTAYGLMARILHLNII